MTPVFVALLDDALFDGCLCLHPKALALGSDDGGVVFDVAQARRGSLVENDIQRDTRSDAPAIGTRLDRLVCGSHDGRLQ